jgi:hypothetical protein
MLNRKQTMVLTVLNIVELILLVAALITFTIIFKIVEEPMRYLFILGDIYVIYSFSKILSNLEKIMQKKQVSI